MWIGNIFIIDTQLEPRHHHYHQRREGAVEWKLRKAANEFGTSAIICSQMDADKKVHQTSK